MTWLPLIPTAYRKSAELLFKRKASTSAQLQLQKNARHHITDAYDMASTYPGIWSSTSSSIHVWHVTALRQDSRCDRQLRA